MGRRSLAAKLGRSQTRRRGNDRPKVPTAPAVPPVPGALQQQPFECLVSFICSQNNNIARISQLVEKLCASYGTSLGVLDGLPFFAFPTLQQLSAAQEDDLRALGFGYRGKFIPAAVQLARHSLLLP